jgi:hypothetical protein
LTKSQSKEEPDDAKVSSPVLKTSIGGDSCAEFNYGALKQFIRICVYSNYELSRIYRD